MTLRKSKRKVIVWSVITKQKGARNVIYVTSDLHGYPLERFQQLLDMAGFGDGDECYVLGDVIDRGADGAALLRWIMHHPRMHLIRGNHEAMMLECRFALDKSLTTFTDDQIHALHRWLRNGGNPTLDGLDCLSFEEASALMDAVAQTPLYAYVEVGGQRYLLTHSGLGNYAPDKPIEAYTERELLWNRPSLDEVYGGDSVVVFGHTPTMLLQMDWFGCVLRTPTWIDVDTGAAMGKEPTLVCLDTMEEYRLP